MSNFNSSSYESDSDMMASSKLFFRRRRACPFEEKGAPTIDYRDIETLSKFTSERGKILPRRITSVSAKKQRELARAIKRARLLALMPYMDMEAG